MRSSFTAAFIGIALSGEVYIIKQQKCSNIIVAKRWIRENEEKMRRVYGNSIKKTVLKY